jgi:plasmid maintenance system antidote protein VapI
MKKSVLQRIEEIMRKYNLNKSGLAKAIEMEQVTVNNYLNGTRKVSFELILSIISKFPDISAEWLLRGEGDMLKADTTPLPLAEDSLEIRV